MSRLFGVIPAAGGGARFGAHLPKQYLPLGGRPLLVHVLERLQSVLPLESIVVALARDDIHYDREIGDRAGVEPIRCGGSTRGETVRNALAALADRCGSDDWIIVHDAARPCVPRDSLIRLLAALRDDVVGGLLAIPLADTLKRADVAGDTDARVASTQDRSQLWCAQTPQMFRFGVLRQALGARRGDRRDRRSAGHRAPWPPSATGDGQRGQRQDHLPGRPGARDRNPCVPSCTPIPDPSPACGRREVQFPSPQGRGVRGGR